MNEDDSDFAKKLMVYLNDGTAQLKAGTAYRLQLARQQALARLADPEPARTMRMTPALAGAGAGAGPVGDAPRPRRSSVRLWLGILAIVVTGFGYQQWQAYKQIEELEETDVAILSSDLPIDAYLDRGFQNWLKRQNTD